MQAVDPTPGRLTTTSYAVLSLLVLRPWTTYELAKQMQRNLHWFWPRAESKLYDEPKKLVAHGLARSDRRFTGRRPTTVYRITPAGRRALARWVGQPGESVPALEFEALLRVFAADNVGVVELRRILESVRDQMEAARAFGERLGTEIATTGGPFPERTHINALVHRFLSMYVDSVGLWAAWALEEVGTWTDTAPSEAKLRRAKATLLTPMADAAGDAARRVRPRPHRRGSDRADAELVVKPPFGSRPRA